MATTDFEFFHNENTKTLIAVPAEPTVIPKKKRGEIVEWFVTVEWIITRNGRLSAPQHPSHTYDAFCDSREQAMRWFKMNKHYPDGFTKIDCDAYQRLISEYSSQNA
jgi:hypothetical protein